MKAKTETVTKQQIVVTLTIDEARDIAYGIDTYTYELPVLRNLLKLAAKLKEQL